MQITIQADDPRFTPTRATPRSAGYDLRATTDFSIAPGQIVKVGTGVHFDFPDGIHGEIMPRSGLAAKHGIHTLAGLVDQDYTGEIIVVLVNHGRSKCYFNHGDRIAQIVLRRTVTADLVLGTVEDTQQHAGFGSTGLGQVPS